jgi:hypothetical protein
LSCRDGDEKTSFFLLPLGPGFRKIAGNKAWAVPDPDISLGGSVQNILKKMKKRLVRPARPD